MKVSKALLKKHNECLSILQKDNLTFDEKIFVYENYIPAVNNDIGSGGIFFTPMGLARDMCIEIGDNNNIVDLCAGIGMLSFIYYHWNSNKDINITCIERNKEFCEIGKKLLPQANWVNDSILDNDLSFYDESNVVISNPPYGNIKDSGFNSRVLDYKGSEFEYKVIEVGKHFGNRGVFIIPKPSSSFKYSGERYYEPQMSNKLKKFMVETNIKLESNCGIDCSIYSNDWKGTKIITEIVLVDYK